MICPKCSWDQPEAPTCARCGVVVARYRALAAAPRPAPAPPRSPLAMPAPPAPRRFLGVLEWTGIGVAVLCAALWLTHKSPPPPRTPPAPVLGVPPPVARTSAPVAETEPALVAEASPLAPASARSEADEVLPRARCPLLDLGLGAEPPRRRVSATWYTSGEDYAQALAEMEATAAPLFVYVHTDWCQYCKAFEQGLLTSPVVSAYLDESAVKVKLNPESGPVAERVARELGVRGFPTILLVLPGRGNERLSIYQQGGAVMREPEEFVAGIQTRAQGQADVLMQRARGQARPENAIADYTRVLQLRPDDPEAYLGRGLVRMNGLQLDEGLDDFAHVARLAPGDVRAVAGAQAVLTSQRRKDEAIACWTGFIDANPSSAAGYWGRAQALAAYPLPGLGAKDAEKGCQLGQAEACRSQQAMRALAAR